MSGDPVNPGRPTSPPPTPPPTVITAPSWLAEDWPAAGRLAAGAALAWTALGGGVVIVLLVGAVLMDATGGLDAGDVAATAVGLPLAYLGAVQGVPVLVTGVVLAVLAFLVTLRYSPPLLPATVPPARVSLLGVKAGLVLAGILLALAIVLDAVDVLPDVAPSPLVGGSGTGGYNYVAIVFLVFPILAVAAAVALQVHGRRPLSALLGLDTSDLQRRLRPSLLGARRFLVLVGPGLWGLWVLGTVLSALGDGIGDAGAFIGMLFSVLLLGAVLSAVDLSGVFLVAAMSFLTEDGFLFGFDAPGWAWAGVILVAAAFGAGGHRAAEVVRPRTGVEAVLAAVWIGPIVSVIGLVLALVWGGDAPAGFPARAVLLPLLWGLVALGGAYLFAQQRGLPSGVVVVGSDSTPLGPASPPSQAQADRKRPEGLQPPPPPRGSAPPPTPPHGPPPQGPPSATPGDDV